MLFQILIVIIHIQGHCWVSKCTYSIHHLAPPQPLHITSSVVSQGPWMHLCVQCGLVYVFWSYTMELMSPLVSSGGMLLTPRATGAPPKIPQPCTAPHNRSPQHDARNQTLILQQAFSMHSHRQQIQTHKTPPASCSWWHALCQSPPYMLSFKVYKRYLIESLGGRYKKATDAFRQLRGRKRATFTFSAWLCRRYRFLQHMTRSKHRHDSACLGQHTLHFHATVVIAWKKYTKVNYRENIKHRINIWWVLFPPRESHLTCKVWAVTQRNGGISAASLISC